MSTTLFRRQAREKPPEMPGGELSLQEPPVLPETIGGGMGGMLMYLPMTIGGGAAMLFFMGPQNPQMALMMAGMMGLMGVMMVFGQMGRGGADRRQRLRGERRDYLRYLSGTRAQIRAVADQQRTALGWRHPEPAALWSVAMTSRLWERRAAHADFAEVRIGVGPQRLAMAMNPLNTKPVADLEPLSARALRRFINAYTTLADQPTALFLRGFAQVRFSGDEDTTRGTVRALLAQLVTFHSPEDLRVAVCASPDRLPEWDWVKWLPHAQHPVEQDGAGQVRLLADGVDALTELLAAELDDRARFEAAATPSREEPYVVVVLDGVDVPAESRLAAAGYRNAVVLDLSGALDGSAGRSRLRLEVSPTDLHTVRTDRTGQQVRTRLGRPDTVSVPRVGALARVISPYRINSTGDVAEPMVADFDLPRLLGVADLDALDPKSLWRTGMGSERFRIPLGIAEDGSSVDLDIKESAQGGMGPHGLLIGATGSGKSELLRTLVLGLAMTHSSEILNFVLVDFKGGATFLGLDRLPHTSAVITNLADEAPLVTRMQDSLHGEMVRRQEHLRAAGNFSSLLDYERARQAGAPLDPLPTLFLIVDEFSELLAANPDFAELFVMIGRLGRSLGVHLLLASQRIDDGRMHKLESHLSYRIGLRTFSAMESRSVIGVPDAYQLPSAPGNGYLRSDVATLVRFKAAYVSGRYQRRTKEQRQEEVRRQVVAFGAGRLPTAAEVAEVVAAPVSDEHVDTVLDVAVEKLLGQGPPAHQVWLPPLDSPPPLDQLLPPLVPHPTLGLTPADWPGRGGLKIPVGVVDKPFEQVRDLHMVDLSGSGGHVGIAGGTQSGKSTLLRTMITALAMTHTPAEVQFYCLDFGGGTLSVLESLPHVGGVCGRLQPERVGRTIAEVKGILSEREKLFAEHGIESMAAYRERRAAGEFADDPHGDVFLVVDGWGSLRADFEQHDQTIRQMTVRGLAYGVHLVITAGRWSDVHSALRDQLGTRLELRLGDAIDSVIDMRKAGQVPRLPGRGLTQDKLHFLGAVPRADGEASAEGLAEATRELARSVAECWPGVSAPRVRTLPAVLPAEELPEPEGRMRVALGSGELDLKPVWHDFLARPHLTVLGDTGSGKTAVLRLIAQAIPKAYGPEDARIVLLDSRRGLLESIPESYRHGVAVSSGPAAELIRPLAADLKTRVPGADITPSRLRDRDWWTGPEYFVIVDDYDLMHSGAGGPLDSLVELLPQAGDIGLHVVLARAAAGSGRMSMDAVVRRLQESNTPDLVLSVPPNEMPLLNGQRGRQLPPGRAVLVTRRDVTSLQIGWTEAPE
ncbi:type VII secretion protein EccCa [Actinokineospora globicatena]|uniref:type VII secretion protein EccCa n=1 Tax=Actinokineospora globicatena TaxID=103729 RepID=UPI0020A26076|nr:type VII secretion protein EccCa [Actinokineospora globicatena]MCP2306604.1 DNA segregation ATPase FtsK/SpoIIIE, S-DNA-T family [Actinokineospora globicatena]GLW82038.1 type VII secretion protein EccC [Actinokineospora globicatena]GLW88832.1 type VII secretion protein EccC [Actinokineospora globicatena]